MDINLRRLRYFMAVAKHGHFGRAAESVFLSTTALSEQIRKLESEFGVRLFDRNPRGAQLTEIGAALVDNAHQVLIEAEHLMNSLKVHRSAPSHLFRLGFVTLAAGEITPGLVRDIKAASPGIQLQLVHLPYARQIDAVLDGEVDASIARGPFEDIAGLRLTPIATEPRMLMLAATRALANRSSVSIADIQNEIRVTTDGVPERWRKWWSLDPNPDGSSPPYGPVIHSWEEQVELAASSIAISIVPAAAARAYGRSDVRFIPISDAEPCSVIFCSHRHRTFAWLNRVIAKYASSLPNSSSLS